MRWRARIRTVTAVVLAVAAFLGVASRADAPPPPDVGADAIDASFDALETSEAWRDATPEERDHYVRWFRATLDERYAAIRADVAARKAERRRASMDSLVAVFNLLYLAAPAVLLLPLVYWRRFRGRRTALVASSLLASAVFVVAVLVFTLSLGLLKEFSLELTSQMDPQLAMLSATYGELHANAHSIVLEGALPVGVTLQQLEGGASEPFSLLLLYNLSVLHDDVFGPAATVHAYWHLLVESLPHLLSLVMAVLFAWGVRDTLKRTWTMPLRVASGDPGAWTGALRDVGRVGTREVLAVLSLLAVLVVLNPVASLAMQGLVQPCVAGLFGFCGATIGILNVSPDPPTTWLVLAVACVPVFLFAGALAITLASVLYLVRALDVSRQRWHDGVPLRAHRRFWRSGTWAMLRAQWVPVLFAAASMPLVQAGLPTIDTARSPEAVGTLVVSTFGVWVGAVLVFWILRGPQALWVLSRSGLTRSPSRDREGGAVEAPAPPDTADLDAA